MLLKRNLLESVTIVSCSGTLLCILLHYVTNISPITGIWFPIYTIFVFIVSVLISIKFIQWLLHLNKPIKYDLDIWINDYPKLSFLSRVLPGPKKKVKSDEFKEYDTNELSVISTVLERKLVSSWYVPYISQEISFPFACKQMLDQMIGRCFQICNKIETKDVFVDICAILTCHLKEYKKALKRQEKSPTSTIESLYKKSHPIFNDTNKNSHPADHCTNILRIVMKDLVPWELWDTPHSELLVRILSKKLDTFIDNTLADPVWLNDRLMTILKGEKKSSEKEKEDIKEEPNPEPVKEVKEEVVVTEPVKQETTIESALSTLITKSTAPILQRDINEEMKEPSVDNEKVENVEEALVVNAEPVEIKTSPVLRQRRGRQGRNEVKIYDRIIEGSVKTWDTDIDLQCISLGQDLLASLDGEITLSRLWGQDTETEGSPNPPRRKSPQPLWFGEEDTLDIELTDASPKEPEQRSPGKKEQSPKPGDALLKDIQSTVHQAKTKIGDLQVPSTSIDVPRKPSDEAAGMMEGLLDFGIAGFKKGLRFTGLSDDSQEKSPSHKEKERMSPPDAGRSRPIPIEHREANVSPVVLKEDNSGNNAPPLLKQQRVISQDSVPSQPRPIVHGEVPAVVPLSDSPEPEYEETADLSTSIAKLRCLLQQRAPASPPRSEEIWWESAEETRGRTQQHHSSRPVDTATLADEYDMSMDRNASPGQTSNNMQRLDKLFTRTVTGVFNSLKTAVGAEGECAPAPLQHWTYVCTSAELSAGGAVARAVGARRATSHVEAARDMLDQLQHQQIQPPIHAPEDFEEWSSSAGARWSGAGAVCACAGLAVSHVAHRAAAVLAADLAESLITSWLDELTSWARAQVFIAFEQMSCEGAQTSAARDDLRKLDIDETCAAVMERMPGVYVFGEETVSAAVRLLVSSFSHKEVNRDVTLTLLDALAAHLTRAATIRNPSFDNN